MSDAQRPQLSERRVTGFTAGAERAALDWIAARLPDSMTPNRLTLIGIAGGVMTGLGYALGGSSRLWLRLAILGFIVHWFGDSLDGTIARRRGIERPRFGMFIDQSSDLLTVFCIMAGLGLSPWVRFDAALSAYCGYLLVAVMVHLRANVTGIYEIAHDGMGPTEGRLILIGITVIMFFIDPATMDRWHGFSGFDFGFFAIAVWCAVTFAREVWRVGRRLSTEEPPRRR
ncbi:MAG: CDP-alcohol phosphatidyltransferase family protein [Beijerinckiaceae bacterium]